MGGDTKLCRAEIYSRLFRLVVDDLVVAVLVDARNKPYSPKQWKSCHVEEFAYTPGSKGDEKMFYYDGVQISISVTGKIQTYDSYVHFWGEK
jgi:hypothetical protein